MNFIYDALITFINAFAGFLILLTVTIIILIIIVLVPAIIRYIKIKKENNHAKIHGRQ